MDERGEGQLDHDAPDLCLTYFLQMYVFKDTGLTWLKERGYEWVKVNCEPGDLVLCE